MAGSFPTLKSGNTVWYPLQDTSSFQTGVLRFMDNSEQRWRAGLMLRRFKLVCNDINTYDVSLVLQFFRSQFGKFDSTWSLTIGSETLHNLAFDTDSFSMIESKRNRITLGFEVIQTKSAAPSIPSAGAYFPQINSNGILTALPYGSQFDYRTTLSELPIGKRYSYKWDTNPLGKYALNLPSLSDAELAVVRDFFYAMEGRKGEFTLLDPGGNLVNYSDDYSNSSWAKTSLTVGAAQTDPYIGNLALRVTSGASNGFMATSVIPSGGASGFVVCCSVWARASGSNQSLLIGLTNPSGTILGSTTWVLPQNQWKRIYHSMTLASALGIKMIIGGSSTWGTSQIIDLFSAQCAPLPGPGPRLLTPGMDGLRIKCRFNTDDFEVTKNGFNDNSVTLPIAEYR